MRKYLTAAAMLAVSALVVYFFFSGLVYGNKPSQLPTTTTVTVVIRHGAYKGDPSLAYEPTHIKVVLKVNNTVVWVNEDIVLHDVTHEPCAYNEPGCIEKFRSKLLDKNESFTFTFDKVGTYRYRCSPHPWMRGTVVVEAGGKQ
ncbi:MAG: plastocyanin/azurin family copper-binding protein [Candidatus Caldarchaeum sp.]